MYSLSIFQFSLGKFTKKCYNCKENRDFFKISDKIEGFSDIIYILFQTRLKGRGEWVKSF